VDNKVMGRAKGKLSASASAPALARRGQVVSESERAEVVDALGFGSLMGSRGSKAQKVVRPIAKRDFVADYEAFQEQERQFIEGAREELEVGMREFARSGQWGAFLRFYTHSPEYSPMNSLWARSQLYYKFKQLIESGAATPEELGDPADGRFFSATAVKALGARVAERYFYRPTSDDFDDRFIVEMCKPLGFNGFEEVRPVLDAQGRPVIDPATGAPKTRKEWIRTTAKGYGISRAYHTRALEDKDGKPFVLPTMPWENATGSDDDAARLIADLERVCAEEGLAITRTNASASASALTRAATGGDVLAALPEHAHYDEGARVITVDGSQTQPEQAVALLRAVCEHIGYDRPAKDERERKIRRAASESAKYAIASLYGLATQDQTFPFIVELAEDEKAFSYLATDTHRRVKSVLGYLDPIMRAKARNEGERKAKAKAAHGRGRKSARSRAAVAA
jgi:hypothetical protein